jgi:hypothetical protein
MNSDHMPHHLDWPRRHGLGLRGRLLDILKISAGQLPALQLTQHPVLRRLCHALRDSHHIIIRRKLAFINRVPDIALKARKSLFFQVIRFRTIHNRHDFLIGGELLLSNLYYRPDFCVEYFLRFGVGNLSDISHARQSNVNFIITKPGISRNQSLALRRYVQSIAVFNQIIGGGDIVLFNIRLCPGDFRPSLNRPIGLIINFTRIRNQQTKILLRLFFQIGLIEFPKNSNNIIALPAAPKGKLRLERFDRNRRTYAPQSLFHRRRRNASALLGKSLDKRIH